MTTITTAKRAAAWYIPPSRHVRALGIGLMLLVVVLQAQVQTSTVFGTITYQDDRPATNVFVSIASMAAYTDDRGRYRIDEVPLALRRWWSPAKATSSSESMLTSAAANRGSTRGCPESREGASRPSVCGDTLRFELEQAFGCP